MSVITLGEIYFGAERCAKRDPVQARRYFDIGDEIWRRFAGAVLPVREAVVQEWARLMAKDPSNRTDALLAATAVAHGLIVATRNEKHFAPLGVPFVNPFS